MRFGLISRMQRDSHNLAVLSECFNPLDVMCLFHRVRRRANLDRCPMLCFFNNGQVLLGSYISGFLNHLCHWLTTANKIALPLMENFNDAAAGFTFVDLIFLCHSVTSLFLDK